MSELLNNVDKSLLNKKVLKMVMNSIQFPYASICKHLVALDLLNMLEELGIEIDSNLVKAISEGSTGEYEAEKILKKSLDIPS